MADNIVGSLFGLNPQMYGEQQRVSALNEGIALANLDPASRGAALTYGGARGLGTAIGGAMGIEDPQLKMISARNTIAQQIDQTDPESILKGAQMLAQMGDQQGAMALAQYARQAQGEMALVQQRRAAEQSSLATAAKTQLSIKQEEQLRDELSKLPQGATQDDVLAILTKYGSPDRVIAALTASASRTEATQAKTEAAKTAADAALERAKVAADAQIQAARERGATALQIAQMQNQTKQDLAVLAASLKGPSAAVLKAQEKAEKAAEGKEVLSDTLETAKTLVNDLYKLGGMTSTSKQPLANLVTSLQTGTVGQIAGQALGTKTQAKRDEIKSIRLQLLNAIKEATGMSAQQLNSNVELKTYLDSLGSEKMTKEANLAIIENISTRYLKGQAAKPEKDKADPLGIR
jgi:uncharacterized small protein (DUF1192 family)